LFEPDWVKPGALVVAMAGNQSPEAFVAGARVVANRWEKPGEGLARTPPYDAVIARGDLKNEDVTELGEVIAGAQPRQSPDDHVVFHLEGGTAHDLFVATWGYQWAKARELGRPFDLSEE